MKRIIKFVSLFLAIALMLIVFAGCKTTPTKTVSSKNIADLKQIELSVFGWVFPRVSEDETGDIFKYYKDKFKVTFKPLTATWNNWEDKLNMYIASGDVPDIFTSYLFERPETYEKWMREEIVLPLDSYLKDYPNIQKRVTEFGDLKSLQDGKVYGIPIKAENRDIKYHNSHLTWIRKDWLSNLNLKIPTTIDEFYNVVKAFANNDPDKNGKKDTFGYCTGDDGVYWAYPIFNAFGASLNNWKKAGDKWTQEVISPEMKNAVTFYKKLYDEKILDPEFFTTNYSAKIDKFITGKIGIMTLNGGGWYETYYNDFKKVYKDKKPEDVFTYLPPLKGVDGKQRLDAMENYFAFTSINADIDDDKKQRALMILDFLLSDEGVNLNRYGIEGTHYKKENNKIVNLIPKEATGYPNFIETVDGTVAIKNLVNWDQDFYYDEKPLREIMLETLKVNDAVVVPNPLSRVYVSNNEFPVAKRSKMTQFVLDEIVKLVYKSSNFDSDWQNFVNEYNSMGGSQFADLMNKKAAGISK